MSCLIDINYVRVTKMLFGGNYPQNLSWQWRATFGRIPSRQLVPCPSSGVALDWWPGSRDASSGSISHNISVGMEPH